MTPYNMTSFTSNGNVPDNGDIEKFIRDRVSELSVRLGRPLTYFIKTFGCQQNDHDSEIAAGILSSLGFQEGTSTDESDVVLFNTCSVRANADDRFYGHVGNLKPIKKDGRPIIGVFGCMMEQSIHVNTIMKTFPYVDFLLGAGSMTHIPYALAFVLNAHNVDQRGAGKPLDLTAISTPSDSITAGDLPVKRQNRQRALVTIMTGCNNFCTYCIVPYTRGREKSRLAVDIVCEVKKAVREGARDVMLLGQNVNSYGVDERKKGKDPAHYPTFAELLSEIALINQLFVLRYMTSHPRDLSDELIDVIGRTPVVEPHIHLPLQSGSDRILEKMNRRYDAEHYLSLVRKLRSARPEITISTDIIVGFPGETEEDFLATLNIMKEARFDAAFTFIYSPREGTPAAHWFNRREEEVDGNRDAVIRDRFARLTALQNQLSYDSNVKLEGKELLVLVDGPSKRSPDIFSGRTRDHRLVNFTAPDRTSLSGDNALHPGDIVVVRIDRAKIFSLEGIVTSILERSI